MKRMPYVFVFAALSSATGALASDSNPLGFYLGAAVGQGRDTVDTLENVGGFQSFQAERATGWKAMVGLRPIPFIGGELEYIDFGSSSARAYLLNLTNTHADAGALYAVGYLPMSVPFLDVFGKLGVARARTTYSGTLSCTPPSLCIQAVNANRTDSAFAYGAGVQAKFESLAFRAEYERLDTSLGHPNLLSLGATWTF